MRYTEIVYAKILAISLTAYPRLRSLIARDRYASSTSLEIFLPSAMKANYTLFGIINATSYNSVSNIILFEIARSSRAMTKFMFVRNYEVTIHLGLTL